MKKSFHTALVILALTAVGLFAYRLLYQPDLKSVTSSRPKNATSNSSSPENTKQPTPRLSGNNRPETRKTADLAIWRDPKSLGGLISSGLDPDDANKLISQINSEVKNIDERSRLFSAIIAALCVSGNHDSAWQLIEQSPGSVRTASLTSWLINNRLPVPDLLKKFNSLEDPKDRETALRFLFANRTVDFLALDTAILQFRTPAEMSSFSSSISTLVSREIADGNNSGAKSILSKAIDLVKAGKLSAESCSAAFANAKGDTAFDQWQLARSTRSSLPEKDFETVMKSVASNMIVSDASRTMDELASDASTRYSYPILSSALGKWYKADPTAANQWLTSNLKSLDPATSQRIISIVSQEANRNMEFETSRKWADLILNPEVRQQLLDQVSKRESEKTQNPQSK